MNAFARTHRPRGGGVARIGAPALTAGLALLAACAAPRDSVPAASAPPDAGGEVWRHLAGKYDGDGDGRIAAAEYARGAETFARLDRDGDGAVTAADVPPEPEPDETAQMLAPVLEPLATLFLLRGFSEDDEDGLERAEMERVLAGMDRDGDGRVTRAEMDEDFARRGVSPFDILGMGRFDVLALAAGVAPGEPIDAARLADAFDARDADGDGRLAGDELPDPGRIGRRPRPGEDEANARAAAGRVAPDFTLPRADGTGPVTLSSFAGERPVALIFGSFT